MIVAQAAELRAVVDSALREHKARVLPAEATLSLLTVRGFLFIQDADREALRAQLSWVHADVAVDTLEVSARSRLLALICDHVPWCWQARLDQLRKEHGSRRALLQVLADKHAEITKV